MQRVLIPVHINTYFTGLLPLAIMLKQSSQFEPVILFCGNYPTLVNDFETCKRNAFEVYFSRDVNKALFQAMDHDQTMGYEKEEGVGKFKKYVDLLKSPRSLIKLILSRIFANTIIWELIEISQQIIYIRRLIRRENISLVVLPADNRYDFSVYVHAAHLEKTGVVVVPQFMAGPLEWAEYVWDQPPYQSRRLLNRLAGALFPRWSLLYKGRKLVALPGAQIIAKELFGIAPPLPWVLHSGLADAVAVESEAVQDYCLAEGLPSEKVRVTGSIAHDNMFDLLSDAEQKRSIICKTLGFSVDRPLILSALPYDNLYMGRSECDFQVYEELVEFWCRSISSIEGYNHVVALHPSVRYDDMKYIEEFGLKITREPTASVIPLCDIFVASISSTIQWAIACGKPVLNYDVFRYRYTDYQNVEGVLTVEEQHEFIGLLKKLTSDSEYYRKISFQQVASSKRWGVLDGMAGARLQDLFNSTIKTHNKEND